MIHQISTKTRIAARRAASALGAGSGKSSSAASASVEARLGRGDRLHRLRRPVLPRGFAHAAHSTAARAGGDQKAYWKPIVARAFGDSAPKPAPAPADRTQSGVT
ncbi:MAG: hypothetical protein DCC71_20435 [Proteobacteria bacterium]|nr:MAG: hypothetical protein DCC71_20435 [Pseudomonadota bacterium]